MDEIGFPFASWAGVNLARDCAIRQDAFFRVLDALPVALHELTRPFGPIVRVTFTVPWSPASAAAGG